MRPATGQVPAPRALRGRVLGIASGPTESTTAARPLSDVTVATLGSATRVGVVTGPTGRFVIRILADSATLIATRIGFRPETLAVCATDTAVTFRLHEAPLVLSPTVVRAERNVSAASSAEIRELDIELRPRESSQELLRLVPGLVIAQHAGGGKAEQVFLRGFDADHGTDVAISVDGTPVNMVTHGHGQGYADLHYLMPEVVDHVDVRKGPYSAEDGDLATAAAIAVVTKDRLDKSVAIRGGSWDTFHAVGLMPFGGDASQAGGYLALSQHATNGSLNTPQKYGRTNFFAKFTAPIGAGAQIFGTADGFGAHWDASGQIPTRAITDGLIDRFGSIDPSEGGTTQRYDVALGLRSTTGGTDQWEVRLYSTRYTFGLYSDFTFFLVDPLHGDEINQTDNRVEVGGRAIRTGTHGLLGLMGSWRLGIGDRADFTNVGLNHVEHRAFLSHVERDHVAENDSYLWGDETLQLTDRVRLQLGARYDLFHFGVRDRLASWPADTTYGAIVHGSGSRWQGLVSPKASLIIDVARGAEVFVNAGYGFHSNDARVSVNAPATFVVLPRALGAEVGSRYTWDWGTVSAAVWGIDLQSELTYDPDVGMDVASGPTRRVGVDLEQRVRLMPWLWLDADLTLSRGRFRTAPNGANYIPLAPTAVSSGGLTARDLGPLSGGVRYRYVNDRPADSTNTIKAYGYTLSEIFARYEFRRIAIVGTIDNLFNVTWNEAEFATTSRLSGESRAGITDLAFTPGTPRSIQLGVEYRW